MTSAEAESASISAMRVPKVVIVIIIIVIIILINNNVIINIIINVGQMYLRTTTCADTLPRKFGGLPFANGYQVRRKYEMFELAIHVAQNSP